MSAQKRWLLAARLFGLLTVACAAYAAYSAASATGDRSWPTVRGTALSWRFIGIMSPAPPSRRASRGGILQRWLVNYEYEVAGQRFQGTAPAGQLPASNVHVYYDPENPAISVLEPGVDVVVVTCALALSGFFFLTSRFSYGAAGSAG